MTIVVQPGQFGLDQNKYSPENHVGKGSLEYQST